MSGQRLKETPKCSPGTQKGDVYSFAIILHEIVVRKGTWGVDIQYRDPRDIVEALLEDHIRLGTRRSIHAVYVHCEKVIDFSDPSRDVTDQTLPSRELIIPGQGEFRQ
jgi:hypothetical protein